LDHASSPHEDARLTRLREYRVTGTAGGAQFDRLARLAAMTMDLPMAVLSLLDTDRVWLLGMHGVELGGTALPGRELPSISRIDCLCDVVLESGQATVFPDTTLDARTRDSMFVTEAPHVRFHAAVPLKAPDGVVVGALCVMDRAPRPAPGQSRMAALREIAALVIDELEMRRGGEPDGQSADRDLDPQRPSASQRGLYAAYIAKSEFLASLSHELRTPLNAISGYAGLIVAADDAPRTVADHAGEIMSAARHMLSLVNDVLEYSRVEAGQLPIAWQRVQLAAISEEAMRMVGVFAASRGVQLERDIDWPDATMRGDPVRMKQVLMNLLTNAIKFTPRGGSVVLKLDRSDDGQVRCAVRDTGIGIAAEDIEKVLTPYGQVVSGDGGAMEGTGLGLPIAKALVERQGGTLTLDSVPGQGTTVTVLMPSTTPPRPARL